MNNLYIIATPIGNISEINNRAKEALINSKFIFCEDTRVSKKLFSKIGISLKDKNFIILNEFTEINFTNKIINFLEKDNCVLISDAGYPMISDPGFLIKKTLNNLSINPIIINGPCSIIHAIILSDFPCNNFYFHGFLNKKKEQRTKELIKIKNIYSTIVIFESVHNLLFTLSDIQVIFGDIKINICKELTKINETKYSGKISEILNKINLKGEFVIVFQNKYIIEENNKHLLFEILALVKKGSKLKESCKMVAYKYDKKPNLLYDLLKNKKD